VAVAGDEAGDLIGVVQQRAAGAGLGEGFVALGRVGTGSIRLFVRCWRGLNILHFEMSINPHRRQPAPDLGWAIDADAASLRLPARLVYACEGSECALISSSMTATN
jgi:hypothetical protein